MNNQGIELAPLPRCACGAAAVFFSAGHDPVISEATDITIARGQPIRGWCLQCNTTDKGIPMPRQAKEKTATANVDPNDIADCAAEYETLMGQRQRIDGKISALFDRFEKKGIARAPIKRAYKRRNLTQDEVRAELAEDALYARVLGHIEWDARGQADFTKAMSFTIERPSGDSNAKLARARAFNDGYNTGKHGGLIGACKHQTGSEEFVAWRDGWEDGAADRAAATPPEAADAAAVH